jgi:hypothetical protein
MIEFELGAKRLPTLCGVTILAGELELIAVRAMARVQSDALPKRNARGKEKENANECK